MSEPRTINLARTLANIAKRAETLWEDGYLYKEVLPGRFVVGSPAHKVYVPDLNTMECRRMTIVTGELDEDVYSPCPSFAQWGTCKHLQAVKATVILEQAGVTKTFTAYGDAAKNNVAQAMMHCLPRMAETRAKARALRDAVNVGAVAAEELPDYEEGAASAGRYVAPKPEPTPNAPITEAQTEAIRSLCRRRNADPDALAQERHHLPLANLKQAEASDLIRSLNQKQAA